MNDDASNWVILAALLRPQGRKGELLAELHTDFPERFAENGKVFLASVNFTGPAEQARAADITEHWLPLGKNSGRIVLKFRGVDSINEAQVLAGLEVLVPREERLPLEDEANYISDLIGCTVYDSGVPVGVITDVQFTTSPDGLRRLEEVAPTLMVTSPNGDEMLVPFAKDFLVAVDAVSKRVEMVLPIGLLDVNR